MTPDDLMTRYRSVIDSALDIFIRSYPDSAPLLRDAMLYAAMGGKRLRGAILLNTAESFGCRTEDALGFAIAVEMIHAYSLVHDDLPCMDDDDTRRGKPSCHKKYGEAMALLCGDALLTGAFEAASSLSSQIPSQAPSSLSSGVIASCIRVLAKAAGPAGMVAGQVLDLALEMPTQNSADVVPGPSPVVAHPLESRAEAAIYEMYRLKTGQLFAASFEIGAVLGGASPNLVEKARAWGLSFGLAYQILDDLSDQTDSPTGSRPGAEIASSPAGCCGPDQRPTLLSFVSRESAILTARHALQDCLRTLDDFPQKPSLPNQLARQALSELS